MKIKTHSGFTLIELSLSLVFIGILSIMMVLIISNVVSAYRRGVTLNRINTVGMDLVDDMRSALQNSSAGSLRELCIKKFPSNDTMRDNCLNDGGYSFVTMTRKANVKLKDGNTLINVPVYGAFCTGDYSYIWNSGYFDKNKTGATVSLGLSSATSATFAYKSSSNTDVTVKDFRLLKIRDETRAVCISRAIVNVNGIDTYRDENHVWDAIGDGSSDTFDIKNSANANIEEPIHLIRNDSDTENDLALYNLSIARPAESTTRENLFYSASFILGTLEGGVNVMSNGKSCAVPTDYGDELFDYCAINVFTFGAQANGK